ncbi:MAG: hypothetical protein HYU69_06595 [Bacteroidetes bacterium]|nr:hypothetical protein [Bacteroidota bacterium]
MTTLLHRKSNTKLLLLRLFFVVIVFILANLFTIRPDHVFIHLIENAPFNRGKEKIYEGVPGNLVAFACKLSFQRGGDGFVSFEAKTKLINHYVKTLGAHHFGGHLMVIDNVSAKKLVNKYFKNHTA